MRLNFLRIFMLAPLALLALGTLSACGGSSAASETTAEKLPGAATPGLPLPTDPFEVIPDGAISVLAADVVAVKASPHAPLLRQWAKAAGCLSPEHEALLFDKTERVIGAGWPGASGEPTFPLIVLKGAYAESDTQLVLDAYAAMTRIGATPVTERMHKRIRVLTRGTTAAARIGDGLLVIGPVKSVESAAALAEGDKAPKLYDGELLKSTGAREQLGANAIVLVGSTTEAMQRQLGKSLGAVGLPRDLASGTLLGLVKIDDAGVLIEARVRKASPQAAADTASAIQRKLGQLSLLARLAGLPRVLEKTEARGNGELLQITMSASHADIAALAERMQDVIADVPACAP